jgi:hypothetical protein
VGVWYRKIYVGGRRVHLHRLRAERALGKPLPPGALVHHADGSKADDAPLVICQDDEYHKLLHARMRVKAAGGDPNTERVCGHCDKVKVFDEFRRDRRGAAGVNPVCKVCINAVERRRRRP